MLFTHLHLASTSGAATAKGLLASSKHRGDLSPQHPNVPNSPPRPEQLARLRSWSSKFPRLAWLLPAAGWGSPAPASDRRMHITKMSLSGVGKSESKIKTVSQLSRWYESGSVTHLPARACWGVSEWNLIARQPRSPRAQAVTRAAGGGEAPICSLCKPKRLAQARCRHGRHTPVDQRPRASSRQLTGASTFELATSSLELAASAFEYQPGI